MEDGHSGSVTYFSKGRLNGYILVTFVSTYSVYKGARGFMSFFKMYVWFSGTMAKPAGSLARSSSLCRSRRSIVPSSPQTQRAQLPAHSAPQPPHPRHAHHPQHTQHSLASPDPDILSVSSCPALYRSEEEEEAIYFSAEKQWYWQ